MQATENRNKVQLSDIPQEVQALFDSFIHGRIDRRAFLDSAAKYTVVGGLTAQAMLDAMKPDYTHVALVQKDDPRIEQEYINYPSPQGYGTVKAYMARPTSGGPRWGSVLVIHENRGLNPYIEDVVRRFAAAGFLAMGPDALTSVGGYPGDDTRGAELQRGLDAAKIRADFLAGAHFLHGHAQSNGKVGAVGFCFGGGVVNFLAANMPELAAGAPFYGAAAATADVPKINAPLLLHFAETDAGINAGWVNYEAALKANNKKYEAHIYPGTSHGFHNNTGARYNEAAAKLAQDRTVAFFQANLR